MKLKSLEIHGFKSFPDRTVFRFQEDGLTVVVGPNGCGKSNIVDAVRWALGEQSAKLLRGQMMEDVIFNGSDRRRPLGMSEVTLNFSNDGSVGGHWRDYAEISVSRKLYRTGESEYSINGVTCRLRDVRELLADAGGSSRGYSIVEQGRISLLINSKPEEKRALIEEAAGVLKYRMRRVEAERKLERTQQNLLRVNDVLREIRRQLDSLKRSAARARRYRLLREELDGLVLRFRFEEFRRLEGELRGLESELGARQADLQASETALSSLESREEELRVALAGGEDGINKAYEAVRGLESDMARLEGDISVREGAIRALEERLARLAHEEHDLQRKGQEGESERVQLELELEAIDGEHRRHLGELEACQGAFAEAEAGLHGARAELDGARGAVFVLGTERTRLDAEVQAAERATEGLSRRLVDGREREGTLRARVEALMAAAAQRRSALESSNARRAGIASRLEEAQAVLARSAEEQRSVERRLSESAERLAELRGLHRTLTALEEEMEGFSDGVKTVLRDYAAPGHQGVLGVVAEYLDVPQRYEKAVVALLGERLQHLIVDRPEDGRSAIDFLKERARGRGGFIPRHPRGRGATALDQVRGDGVVGPLTDLVGFSSEMNGVGDVLLGGALVVEDLGRAISLWQRNGFSATMVTLDGDVVEASGVITGGSLEPGESNPLARKRRLREVNQAAAAAEAEVGALRARQEALLRQVEETGRQAASLSQELREAERACVEDESAFSSANREAEHLRGTLEDVLAEVGLVESERTELGQRTIAQRERLGQVRREEAALQERMAGLESAAHRAGLVLEERRLDLEQARLRVSTVTLRRESSQRALETALSRSREVEERFGRMRAEMADARARAEGHRAGIAGGRESLLTLSGSLESRKADLLALREAQEARRAEADALSVSVRETRSAGTAIRQACASLDIRIHEVRKEREHVVERVREEHGLAIQEVDGSRFGEGEFDRASAQDRIAELRQKIGGLGEVNPSAVEEFEELNSRYVFMDGQKADLERSIESLNKAIRKINRLSRERFLATFAEVQRHFGEVFPRLFEGGAAQMALLDENDPLNTGVEIQVQLPGKKLRSMQLLSGGEKALVSMAMVLSLFLVKPSPFCILDEVDAPLDEDNLGHFASIVKEMASRFQFLVITHNKLTMEAADVLYGITMREPGVSQVVSVRLRDVA